MRRRVLLLCLALSALPARTQTIAERYLLSAINQERLSHNLAAVHLDAALGRAAGLHAQRMAEHGTISHQFPSEPELADRGASAGARFDRITENVAEGPSVLILHDALMHSPGHRANILDPAVDVIGIAVMTRGNQLYAVEDFAHDVPRLTVEQQEGAVAALLDQVGLELLPDEAARATCIQAAGYAGDRQPAYIVRYTTADMTQLPTRLRTRLATRQDRSVAIGACTPPGGAFTSYSLVVLLYP